MPNWELCSRGRPTLLAWQHLFLEAEAVNMGYPYHGGEQSHHVKQRDVNDRQVCLQFGEACCSIGISIVFATIRI